MGDTRLDENSFLLQQVVRSHELFGPFLYFLRAETEQWVVDSSNGSASWSCKPATIDLQALIIIVEKVPLPFEHRLIIEIQLPNDQLTMQLVGILGRSQHLPGQQHLSQAPCAYADPHLVVRLSLLVAIKPARRAMIAIGVADHSKPRGSWPSIN